MRYLISLVVPLAVAGCGGAGGEDDRDYIAENVWRTEGQICAEYRPAPQTFPDRIWADCVPDDWPSHRFCWRTEDVPLCAEDNPDKSTVAVIGCVLIADPPVGRSIGEQYAGCVVPGDCIADAIDNPPCCDETERPGTKASWDCATP